MVNISQISVTPPINGLCNKKWSSINNDFMRCSHCCGYTGSNGKRSNVKVVINVPIAASQKRYSIPCVANNMPPKQCRAC